MNERLSGAELVALIRRVFAPRADERQVGLLIDLPDARVPDNADWAARRAMAIDWVETLRATRDDLGMEPLLAVIGNTHANNADLPDRCWIHAGGSLPACLADLDEAKSVPLASFLSRTPILMVPTEFSATAPLKMLARRIPFRAATMGGFCPAMIPALRVDYAEVNRRVNVLKAALDRAAGADCLFSFPGGAVHLHLDLRFRHAHASAGMIHQPGTAGNLPSGEAYIVPFEGESEKSRSAGRLPVQFDDEVVIYRVENNRAVAVESEGPASRREAARLARAPAYGNLAELGLGVLGALGVKPVGEVLLDEKLGLHIAFGRSEHFGGQVGPDAFPGPDDVIHIDRVYVPEIQPAVSPVRVDLVMDDGTVLALMRDGEYVIDCFGSVA